MTNYIVIEKDNVRRIRGYDDIKVKYTIKDTNNDTILYAFYWCCLGDKYVVYDSLYDNDIKNYTWSTSTSGYVYSHDVGYMHSFVMRLSHVEITNPGLSIDHINEYKLDNRVANLRVATQSEQNANRGTRSDKIKPCDELVAAGVYELPRYVRWDKSESKFIIEKHPYLMQEVKEEKRKKATMSGTKSRTLTVVQKYQDILARLKELDDKLQSDDFKIMKERLKREYEGICQAIQQYETGHESVQESREIVEQQPNADENLTTIIIGERRTQDNRKTISKLPPDCGIKPEDIPKYCYYQPASDKRGDKFVIDKHPALLKSGKRQWSTSGKTSESTQAKYRQLMEKYGKLERNE